MARLLTILILLFPYLAAFAQGEKYEEQGYLSKALESYRKEKDLNGIASVLTAIGQYDSVMLYIQKSRTKDPSTANLVRNYQVEAKYLQSQNKYDQALASLQLAKDAVDKTNDTKNKALILSSMGSIYFSHEPDKNVARDYFLKSNAICDSSKHYDILARNYGKLANVAMNLGDGATAKMYLDRAYKIVELSGNLSVKAFIISSQAILASGEDRMDESIRFLEESIRIKRELGLVRPLQNDLLNISEAYMQVKKFDKAEVALKEVGKLSRSLQDHVYMKYYYERAAMLDSLKGDYKGAFWNYRQAMAFKDSTFSAQRLRDVKEIQEKYESEQKEKVIAEKELEIERQKYQQAVMLGIAVVGILVLIIDLNSRRARRRKEQNQLRLQTIVTTQEEVQQRIARDLHDGLVQVLGAAKMSLQAIGPGSDKEVIQKQIRNASEIIDEAVNEARSISHEILPYSLLKDGLAQALEELFARSLASYEFNTEGEVKLSEQATVNFYRIVQELVNNVQKYAPDAHVLIELKNVGDKIHFAFGDDGAGFDTTIKTKGAGLSNIMTRADVMAAEVQISSKPGDGTLVVMIIPV